MADDRQDRVLLTESRMHAQVEWRHFRAKNGIAEEAHYPESHIWHFAIVAACALVETGVNSFFYENSQGLLGGFFVALAVAIVNLGGALALGMSFRFKNLRDTDKKIAGWLALFAFVALAIYCNALFASFRAEYQFVTDPSNASALRVAFTKATDSAGRVFTFQMHFGDLLSFILFGIGILLSSFAFYKGYTFDDRYPGYGKRDRAVKHHATPSLPSKMSCGHVSRVFCIVSGRSCRASFMSRRNSSILPVCGLPRSNNHSRRV